MKLTREQIDELIELEKAATPGPWDVAVIMRGDEIVHAYVIPETHTHKIAEVFGEPSERNANQDFLYKLRNAAPALLEMAKNCEEDLRNAARWKVAYDELDNAFDTQEDECRGLHEENRALKKENQKLRELLREVEWCASDFFACPMCWSYRVSGHAPDCKLKEALGYE